MIIYYLKCKRHAPSTTSFTRVTLLEWIRCTSRVEHIPLVWGIIFKVWTNVYLHFHISNRKKYMYMAIHLQILNPLDLGRSYIRGGVALFIIPSFIFVERLLYISCFIIHALSLPTISTFFVRLNVTFDLNWINWCRRKLKCERFTTTTAMTTTTTMSDRQLIIFLRFR